MKTPSWYLNPGPSSHTSQALILVKWSSNQMYVVQISFSILLKMNRIVIEWVKEWML